MHNDLKTVKLVQLPDLYDDDDDVEFWAVKVGISLVSVAIVP